jgi:hypothetical protein
MGIKPQDLANQLDCITEAQFTELFSITPSTARAWRQRHKAPLPVLIGNTYLYPLDAIRAELEARKKSPRGSMGVLV